jgi:hypothetical protein
MMRLLLWCGYGFGINVSTIDGLACQVREVLSSRLWGWGRAFEETDPPGGRVKRAVVVVQRRVDVVEEVPDCIRLAEFTCAYKDDVLCPTTMPHISSLGTVPCMMSEKHRSTHGRYGALKMNMPKKLSCVSGFLRLQI